MIKDLNEILVEWSYRTSDGKPDVNNNAKLILLENVLSDFGWSREARAELLSTLMTEDDIVKNKETGNVYTVKNVNKDKHQLIKKNASKDDITKVKKGDGEDKEGGEKDKDDEEQEVSDSEVAADLYDYLKYVTDEQKKAIELSGKMKVKQLKKLDSLVESFKNLPDNVRNTATSIFAKGQIYAGRPNNGIGKNRLGYLDVKTLSENKEYLLEAYGDGSPEKVKEFVEGSRNIKVSEDYVNSSFELLPLSFQKALSGKGMTGDKGKGKHFLGYIKKDGSITSDKTDSDIEKDESENLSVKRGQPPNKGRGKFVWRAILEQGGKDPYTGLPLDLSNIDLEHTVAFDNNDNGNPTEQDYLDREHDDNIIICATNINQKKTNSSMKEFLERHVDTQSDKNEEEFTDRDDAYAKVNTVADNTKQKAGLLLEEGKLKEGLNIEVLSETFKLDDEVYISARDEFKRVVDNPVDAKKIGTLKSELGKDTLMAMGLNRGLTKKSGRGTLKLSSDNLYRGFLLSMSANIDKQDEYKKEWEAARKVGNSDEYRLKGKGQQGMIKYLIDKKLISKEVLDNKKLGKVFRNALKEVFDYDLKEYVIGKI